MVSSSLQGLVAAGLADMTRPAEKLSTSQSAVLTATGKMGLNRFNPNTHDKLETVAGKYKWYQKMLQLI